MFDFQQNNNYVFYTCKIQIDAVGIASLIDLSICTWLQRLSISACGLYQVPSSIVLLTDLIHLALHRNRLTSIDTIDFKQMSKLTTLEVVQFLFLKLFAHCLNLLIGLLQSTWSFVESKLEQCNVVAQTRYFKQSSFNDR
jgi:hypothetical protein